MKTTKIKTLLWITVAGVSLTPAAFTQDSSKYLAYKGKFTGSATMTGPEEDDSSSGTATAKIKVPRNGTSATLNYTATLSDGMNTSVLPTVVTFSKNGKVFVSDLLVGIAGTNNAKPGTGNSSAGRRSLKFDADNGDGITLRGTAVFKDLRNKRKLTLTLVSDDGVGTRIFKSSLRARLPRR